MIFYFFYLNVTQEQVVKIQLNYQKMPETRQPMNKENIQDHLLRMLFLFLSSLVVFEVGFITRSD